MRFEPGQKIVCIGDSITDCDRRGHHAPLGNGYVKYIHHLLLASHPELNLVWVNRGVSGDTSRDLAVRWQADVLEEQPDWLVLMIGANDVWRAFGGLPNEAVPLPEYQALLRRLLKQAQLAGIRLVLLEPFLVEPDRRNLMRRQIDLYGEIVRGMATEFDAVLVRTQAAFDAAMESTDPTLWSPDQVHPSEVGHTLIALAVLKALDWTAGASNA